MTHQLREEDLTFLDRAPIRVEQERVIGVPAARVWPWVVDAAKWPTWFGGMKTARMTSDGPPAAGGTRFVEVGGIKANEVLLAVEANHRYAFRIVDANLRFLAVMVEEVTLDESDGATTVRYVQAVELSSWYRWMAPLLRRQLGKALGAALDGLKETAEAG
ncbi:MAG: SRPBCC family protein [Actinomycetota bacterium]